MIIIEVFERGATPRHRPTAPPIVNQDRHLMTASQSRKSARRARWLSTGHGRARSDIQLSSQIVRQFTRSTRPAAHPCSRFTVGQLAGARSTPITHLIRGTQIPIAPRRTTSRTPPAVSSLGGLRTPAPVPAAPPSWGRHPKTFTKAEAPRWGISSPVLNLFPLQSTYLLSDGMTCGAR